MHIVHSSEVSVNVHGSSYSQIPLYQLLDRSRRLIAEGADLSGLRLPARPPWPMPGLGQLSGDSVRLNTSAPLTGHPRYHFEVSGPAAGLQITFPWGYLQISTPKTHSEGVSSFDEFDRRITPWIDWALGCAEAWFQCLGQVPEDLEPDPVARAELTGRWRREGRLLVPLRFTRSDVTLAHTCESEACPTIHQQPCSGILRHAATYTHLASEFGVPVSQVIDQARAAHVLEGLSF